MQQPGGNLVILAQNAKLKRDTEWFGKMDPFVRFQVGSVVIKTKEAKDQGKTPKWNEQLSCRIQNQQIITFDVFDKDGVGSDEYIAQGSYSLAKVYQYPGQTLNESVPLQYKGKDAGTINLSFQFFPDAQQGGFNNNYPQFNQQQGFNQPPQQGFNQPPQQGFNQPPQQGFNQPPQQGFNQPPQQGFNQPPQQYGGFNQPPQQHGFNQPPQQHGFNQPPQQHGFNQPGFNQPPQQHGFNQPPQQHGFNQPQGGLFMGKYPWIQFKQSCSKCHGTGVNKKKNNGNPCGSCYSDAGYCKKCCGSTWDIKKNKKCEKCHNGRGGSKDKKKKH